MKTIILTHADCDGICAGAIAQARFPDADVFFTKPVSLLSDLRSTEADRIIICDIAITKNDAKGIVSELAARSEQGEVLYFDHHELPESIKESDIKVTKYVHDLHASASELIYKQFQNEIPGERVWIALYGAIGDYEDQTEFAKERIANWDRRVLFFEVSTLVLGIKNKEFDTYDAKRHIVKSMAHGENPSDVPGLVQSAKNAVTREFELYEFIKENAKKIGKAGVIENAPSFGFRGPAALFAATVTDAPVGLCVYNREKHIDVTARKRKADISLNRLMEKSAEAVGGSGGGHRNAAGARIPLGTLDEFIKHINKLL